jgi:small subunit ribosomal protein S17
MAEEKPENLVEEAAAAGDTPGADSPEGDTPAAADSPEGDTPAAAETPAAAVAPPAGQTRRERLEARRSARRPAPRGPMTPEERDAERRARRAGTAKQRRAYRAKLKDRRTAARAEQPPAEPAQAPEHGPGRPKTRQGVVVSSKADKTIVVEIDVVQRHRRYHKILRSTVKLVAHDEANNANEGDTVRVVECRPMSRTKRWRLTDVLERAR